jgi:hypothetical protein
MAMTSDVDPVPAAAPDIIFSAWRVEGVDLELLGIDPITFALPELIEFCRAALGTIALDASTVTLVIAGDFEEAIRVRFPEDLDLQQFSLSRGSGQVGAKTMRVGDEIHVVFPAWPFFDASAIKAVAPGEDFEEFEKATASRHLLVKRTAIHEANHVAMTQANEDSLDTTGKGLARRHLLDVALHVIEEYRAELGMPSDFNDSHHLQLPADAIESLRAELTRIVTIEYPSHDNVWRLAMGVLEQASHAWKRLAYVAAARRVEGIALRAPFPDNEIGSDWNQMVAPLWGRFERLLSQVPSARTRISIEELTASTRQLADLLDDWLVLLGFRWRDVGDSNSHFAIESLALFE